jgi:hypothetical protein
MRSCAVALAIGFLAVPVCAASAQAPPGARVVVPAVPARPEDVASIDAIIAAFYDVISGPAGQPRQWSRDRSLYIPGVRFVSTGYDPQDRRTVSVMDHQQFVDATDSGFVARGFYETEIHRATHRVNDIARVLHLRMHRARRPGLRGGVNSLELYWDGTRWWIAGAVWIDEAPGHPLPADVLPR